jgi:hypothetical protein
VALINSAFYLMQAERPEEQRAEAGEAKVSA